jgi:EmrB/QacA subfamily drug resistance transporter
MIIYNTKNKGVQVSQAAETTVEPRQSAFRKWIPLAVMGLAVLIIVIDTTLLNVSLGVIIRDLKTDIQSIQWVITAYSLTLAALTITGGRLGDLFGRKKMFMLGAVIFALGSFLASISHHVGTLIIGESIVEGIGAALMMPATASLLVSTYRGRDRALALGIWGGMAAAGSAIGPVLGGYLTSHYGWRWGFRINVFVAMLLLAGSVLVKEARDREEKASLDVVGVLLSSLGLLAGVFAIIEGGTYGWLKALSTFNIFGQAIDFGRFSIVPGAIAASVVLLVAFYLWEQKVVNDGGTPLVSMKIFKNKQFSSGALTTALMSTGMTGLIFALPVFLQGVRGLDSLHTGYVMLPLSAGLLIMAPLGGFLSNRFYPKFIVFTGLILNIIGLLLLRRTLSVTATSVDFILPLLTIGAGMGLCFSQLTNITLSAVSVDESGEASGVNNTLRQVGSSLGAAIVGTVLLTSLASNLKANISSSQVLPAEHLSSIASEVTQQSSAVEFGEQINSHENLSEEQHAEIKSIANESTVAANKATLIYTIGFMALALVLATQLPKTKQLDRSESMATSAAH